MNKIKYQTKFFLYHTAVLISIILGIVGCFYYLLSNEIQEKDQKDFKVITEKTADQVDSLFYEMDLVALQIAANPSVVNVFQGISESEDNYFTTHPIIKTEVKSLLESYNFKNDSFARICLYNDYGDFVCTSNRAVTEKGILQFFELESFRKTQKYFEEPGNYIYYKFPEKDTLSAETNMQKDYFSVVREIKDYYSNSSQCGYIEVQDSTEWLHDIFGDFGQDMYVSIYDEKGDIFFQTSKEHLKTKDIYESEIKLKNAPYTVNFKKNPVEYQKAVKQFVLLLVLALILLIFVAIVLEKKLIYYLTKPLLELNRSMEAVTMDNLHVDIVDEGSIDVLLKLETTFNAMLAKLNESMQMQIIAQTNEIKAQFFALQSQLNPHFIHNMLAIISMESQMDGNNKIPYICQNLGKILRYNAQMEDGYSTVEQECCSADNYMKLMKVRYEELFRYEIEIKDSINNIRIPKLILQPLCENCFQHGLKNVEPEWIIKVIAWRDGDRWFLKVTDNGSGFTKDFLEKFEKEKERINKTDVKNVLESMKIGGLCLSNIYIRMKIEYGESMTFELMNENGGAVVLLGGDIFDTSSGCRR